MKVGIIPNFTREKTFEVIKNVIYYLEKFKSSYVSYLKQETLKLSSKYKCCIYGDEMILLSLYKNIEKRGFRVEYKGKSIDEICYIDAVLNTSEIEV